MLIGNSLNILSYSQEDYKRAGDTKPFEVMVHEPTGHNNQFYHHAILKIIFSTKRSFKWTYSFNKRDIFPYESGI